MQQGYKEIKINKKDSVRDVDDLAVDIGTNITRARLLAGLTQVDLAKKMGATQPSLARYESGTQMASGHFLVRVADALKTHVVAPTFESLVESKKNHEHKAARYSCTDLYGPVVRVNVFTDSHVKDKNYSILSGLPQWAVTASNN